MGHQVREINILIVVDERDGPINDIINELIIDEVTADGERPDWVLSAVTLSDHQRPATANEIETLWKQGGCPTCGEPSITFIDGDCQYCNPTIEGSETI